LGRIPDIFLGFEFH